MSFSWMKNMNFILQNQKTPNNKLLLTPAKEQKALVAGFIDKGVLLTPPNLTICSQSFIFLKALAS
jgi:hypothetical protein